MGLLSSIFGGGGSSSSSKTSNTSQTGDGGAEAAIGSSGDQVALSNIGSGVELQINERPVDLAEVGDLLSVVNGGAVDVANAAVQAALEASEPVANIARSSTGSQSEVGRLVGQLALPGAAVAALWFVFGRKK